MSWCLTIDDPDGLSANSSDVWLSNHAAFVKEVMGFNQ
jgi:hypothetical protein